MGKPKITVFEVKENKEIDIMKIPIQENRIIHKNPSIDAEFKSSQIFNACFIKTGLLAWIRRKRGTLKRFPCLIHRSGSNHCVSLEDSHLIDKLTNEESIEIVKRNMALGMRKFEPIALKIAVFIILLQIIVIILMLLNMGNVRI